MFMGLERMFFFVLLCLCVASNSGLYGMEAENASDYGFSALNDGDGNRKALQAALNGGG